MSFFKNCVFYRQNKLKNFDFQYVVINTTGVVHVEFLKIINNKKLNNELHLKVSLLIFSKPVFDDRPICSPAGNYRAPRFKWPY